MAADAECPERGHIGQRRRLSPVRRDDSVGDRVGVAIPAGPAAGAHEPPLCERLQRSAMDGQPLEHDADQGPDDRGAVLECGHGLYLWNRVALSLIEDRHRGEEDSDHDDRRAHRNTLLENARLLGALDVAMADAAIGCWDAKNTYNFWRPITAIQEHADDGNPFTTPDPAWTPLFTTPAHPDYPSGHSCVSAAAALVLSKEFGARTQFRLTSDLMLGVSRSFRSFSAALDEVKDARVFAGIHFRTATEVGSSLGAAVGQWVLENAFQRVD